MSSRKTIKTGLLLGHQSNEKTAEALILNMASTQQTNELQVEHFKTHITIKYQ